MLAADHVRQGNTVGLVGIQRDIGDDDVDAAFVETRKASMELETSTTA